MGAKNNGEPTTVHGLPFAVDIEAVDASGDGLARHGGTPLLVPFTIPGERVQVRLDPRPGRPRRAVLEAVVRPSPHRIQPRCPHFGPPDRCGGCAWQHIDYREQLRLKTDLVRRLISTGIGRSDVEVEPTLPAVPLDDPWGYRHKVHFVFGAARDGGLLMGHFARGSRRVFMAHECPVHDPRGNAVAFAFHDACVRARVAAAPEGTLRHLAVRVAAGTGATMATLVASGAGDKRLRAASARALERPGAPASFHLNLHERSDPYIFGRETRHISGPRQLREEVAGVTFLVSPTAFFQTNVRAAAILVDLALEALPAGRAVLDLYAGVGLFALPMARRGDSVTAIEENRTAVADGVASRALNGIGAGQCRFVARRVGDALRSVRAGAATHVVLDPPRDGCEPGVLDEVFGRLRPDRVAYVSCNPEALAVDLPIAVRHGYRIARLQPVDMFPHTAHVETVATLERAQKGPAVHAGARTRRRS
jgi:23S rRNA (uracil1939-C5)-methyltransferase